MSATKFIITNALFFLIKKTTGKHRPPIVSTKHSFYSIGGNLHGITICWSLIELTRHQLSGTQIRYISFYKTFQKVFVTLCLGYKMSLAKKVQQRQKGNVKCKYFGSKVSALGPTWHVSSTLYGVISSKNQYLIILLWYQQSIGMTEVNLTRTSKWTRIYCI
jgi:hypothetical protein